MILVTGAAGFIGFHLCQALLARGDTVVGIDNLNDYYDVSLKQARLDILAQSDKFTFVKLDIADRDGVATLFQKHAIERVVHLAAQAGVRYSLKNPYAYVDANMVGFVHVIENCRQHDIKHLVFASTSSVYGANTKQPFAESDNTDHPLAIYSASKKANELTAHAYASLYQLPCTGLRYFTVYGPWGRPDMALFKFTKAILAGETIEVYNYGKMKRDFTYVDDIVAGTIRALDNPAQPDPNWDSNNPDPCSSYAPYKVYNIGNSRPTELMDYIHAIETALGKKAQCKMLPMQAGDVPSTYADTSRLEKDLGYKPKVSVQEGVKRFVTWYLEYYKN